MMVGCVRAFLPRIVGGILLSGILTLLFFWRNGFQVTRTHSARYNGVHSHYFLSPHQAQPAYMTLNRVAFDILM